ncbi:uncharacterized protein BDV17DRAFT_287401 [Aspergillus undulatus]|uniref:uncharacterized protein n=1 Tax=Aspergillus undulatus TaxID=1810928 RepID=UPI003CCCBDFF
MAFYTNFLAGVRRPRPLPTLRVLSCRPSLTRLPVSTPALNVGVRSITTTQTDPRPALQPKTETNLGLNANDPVLHVLERTVLRPERAETTCSGTDNAVGTNIHSYDPHTTTPETEFATFEEEVTLGDKLGETDPLFISPANRDFSQLLDRELDGRAIVRDKGDRMGMEGSVRGWVKKGKAVVVKSGGRGGVTRDEFERLCRGLRRVQMK